jgi:mannose-6-phosphate isomerase-like protein (cupin superfamily)
MTLTAARIGPAEGDFTFNTRFLVEGGDVAILEHVFAPGVLAGPVHRHTREDEYSYVITGHPTFWFDGEELVADPGDLVLKPRDQWHTVFNERDEEARILEVICPAGLERLFRRFGAADGLAPEDYAAGAAEFGCDLDFERTMELLGRGLELSG